LFLAVMLLSPTSVAEPRLGLTLDAGVPDGASLGVVYRPEPRLRFHAGASHNSISAGARAGITLAPVPAWISPTLSLDIGRFAEGDANPFVRRISGDDDRSSPLIESLGYRYVNAHVGLQWGRERTLFYVHGGASYVTGTLGGLEDEASDAMVTFSDDPSFAVWTPSLRIGLVVFLL
jgi:hypothetical protein